MEKAVGALWRTERTNETTNVAAFKSPPLSNRTQSHMSSASRFPPSFTFLPNFIRESPCVKRRVRHKT